MLLLFGITSCAESPQDVTPLIVVERYVALSFVGNIDKAAQQTIGIPSEPQRLDQRETKGLSHATVSQRENVLT